MPCLSGTRDFLAGQVKERSLDLQLLHGAVLLNDAFQDLRFTGIYDPESGGEIRAGEWFTHKKRALLSEYGVGTVDQALLPILPVRHNFVRLWGLANRVVVLDEIHAYDAYTSTLLVHLLRWLLALGSSVVLLSATLPPSTRRKLAAAVGVDLPAQDPGYPRLTVFNYAGLVQMHFTTDPKRRRVLHLEGIPTDLPALRMILEAYLAEGGMGLVLVNTVQRAQDIYPAIPGGRTLGEPEPARRQTPFGRHGGVPLPCAFSGLLEAGSRGSCTRLVRQEWHKSRPQDSYRHPRSPSRASTWISTSW